MGVRFPSVGSTTAGTPSAPPSEWIAATSPPINQSIDGQVFLIIWSITYLGGAVGPQIAYNIRRGPLTSSTLITSGQVCTEVASVRYQRSGNTLDSPGIVANLQYSLSCNISNAATAVTVQDVSILVLAL